MPKTKVGIIGVGKLGTFHCNALSQISEAELVGIYDVDQGQAQEVATRFRCRSFSDLNDLLANIDAAAIVVPTVNHFDVAQVALEAGKPIFVEKPIAGSVKQAQEMVALAKRKSLPLQVGHIERFNPAIQALNGAQLKPMFIESHRLAPFDPRGTDVAVVLDLMIHDIDIILSLVQGKVKSIDANGVAVVSEEVDIANARIQFDTGCVANVTASRISQRKMRKMRLFQRDAYISIDFLQRLTEVFRIVDENEKLPNTVILGQIEKGKRQRHIIYEQPTTPEMDAMQAEWRSFFKAIQTGSTPIVSGEDGLNALVVATEITAIIAHQKLLE
jgi:predicted dehydrogenase